MKIGHINQFENQFSFDNKRAMWLNYTPVKKSTAGTIPMSSRTDARAQNYQPVNATPVRQPTGPGGYSIPIYKPPVQQTLGARTTSGGGGMPSSPVQQQQQQPYQQIQQQQDNGNAQIDDDYNQSMGMLDSAQSGLQGQASSSSAQITNDAASVRTSLGAQQATGEQGVQSSLSTSEKQGTSAMQQARDLFRQTQQSNNAQLSALGISSSSVSEALAERLGIETARRIAGVTGGLDEVRLNAVNELGRVKNYYAEKKTQLDENVRIQKDQIQQSLMQGLNQINSARSQAASAKSEARANLLSQVQTQIYQLTTQQQQFDQSLKTWATQKSAALTPLTTNTGLQEQFKNFSNLTQSGSFDTTKFSADMKIGTKGTPTYGFSTINPTKGKKDEEEPEW